MKARKKLKVLVPPFGYAYLQEDGSWLVPGKEQGNAWEYKISADNKVITMTPSE